MKDFSSHLEVTKNNPPSPLLLRAITFVNKRARAIDVGAGGLKDTPYLLEQGMDVTVLDSEPFVKELAATILSDKLHVHVSPFENFVFPKRSFDLATAMYSLPFIEPKSFIKVFEGIIGALKRNGIFSGNFFGIRDSWHDNALMTFHNKSEVENLLSELQILTLEEEERNSKTADGNLKHWHIFQIIARKIK